MTKLNIDNIEENDKYKAMNTVMNAAENIIKIARNIISTTPKIQPKEIWSDKRIIDALAKYQALNDAIKINNVYDKIAEADTDSLGTKLNSTSVFLDVQQEVKAVGEIKETTDL